MNKLIYITGLLLILIVAGCSKDFLEIDPIGYPASENFLKTDQEVYTAMIGIYDQVQYNYSNGSWASVFFIKNLPADDVLCAGGSPTDQSEYQYLDDFKISSDNSKIQFIWTNFYKAINSCNTVITRVGENPDATDEMKQMVAEAKAVRAFTYLDLVTMFGGVPILTTNPITSDEYSKPRASKADVYALIEKDLNDAIALLPLKSEYSAADKFRFSKGTAQSLLGKALLYQEKYSEAATVLAQVIASGEYDLEPNYEDNWVSTHEFGIESVYEISYSSQFGYDWGTFGNYWGANGAYNNIECQLEGPRDAYFDVSNSSLGVVNGWGFNLPSAKIGDLMYSRGETKRMSASLISAADFETTGGKMLVSVNDNPKPHDYEGYMRLKYVTRTSESGTSGVTELNYGTNWRIIRYADVLLMAAEAYNKSGQDGPAQTELFKVRDRAGFSAPITQTGTDLFNLIVEEREVELAFEGSRYWDLIRWGKAVEELGDLGYKANKNELFPIPLNEIIGNTAMTEDDQNPGY